MAINLSNVNISLDAIHGGRGGFIQV